MTPSPQYVHIHGRKYDISNFSHPGGKRIIESYVDRDASLVFDMFHKNSTVKVMKYLKALPNEPSEKRLSVIEEDFIQFRNRLDAEGMFAARPFDIIWRTIIAFSLSPSSNNFNFKKFSLDAEVFKVNSNRCIRSLGTSEIEFNVISLLTYSKGIFRNVFSL